MTHETWERGEQLTIHNATKSQLQLMVNDRDKIIKRLYAQLEENRKEHDKMIAFYHEIIKEKLADKEV